jgi:hypothetical protein
MSPYPSLLGATWRDLPMAVVNHPPRGATATINIAGEMTFVRIVGGGPVVYLFDEYHPDEQHGDACVQGNIANGQALRQSTEIGLVGVEGYEGGLEYDPVERQYLLDNYIPGEINPVTLIGAAPQFAQAMQAAGLVVVGVDCRGLCDFIELDEAWDPEVPRGNHPDHVHRTRHFLNTLFRERARLGRHGDVMLNAGRNHIERIVGMVADGTVDRISGVRASYVRLRHPAYPNA